MVRSSPSHEHAMKEQGREGQGGHLSLIHIVGIVAGLRNNFIHETSFYDS